MCCCLAAWFILHFAMIPLGAVYKDDQACDTLSDGVGIGTWLLVLGTFNVFLFCSTLFGIYNEVEGALVVVCTCPCTCFLFSWVVYGCVLVFQEQGDCPDAIMDFAHGYTIFALCLIGCMCCCTMCAFV